MKRNRLRLLPYDPAWKDDFLAERNRICERLKKVSIEIEHVGSTAIPTVNATKAILDIAILCNVDALDRMIEVLTDLGYEYRGKYDTDADHYYAVRDSDGVRLCQAHIFTEANWDWNAKLKFRDVLRRNPALASEYSRFKLELAETASGKKEYAETKSKWMDTFVTRVMSK